MKKELPKPKRTLKSFILEEDAKVIDKTTIKIAALVSFIGFGIAMSAHDANGFMRKHSNHNNHSNNLNVDNGPDTDIHAGVNPYTGNSDETILKEEGVTTIHSNHYNHGHAKKLRGFVGAAFDVFSGIAGLLTYGAGWGLMGQAGSLSDKLGWSQEDLNIKPFNEDPTSMDDDTLNELNNK